MFVAGLADREETQHQAWRVPGGDCPGRDAAFSYPPKQGKEALAPRPPPFSELHHHRAVPLAVIPVVTLTTEATVTLGPRSGAGRATERHFVPKKAVARALRILDSTLQKAVRALAAATMSEEVATSTTLRALVCPDDAGPDAVCASTSTVLRHLGALHAAITNGDVAAAVGAGRTPMGKLQFAPLAVAQRWVQHQLGGAGPTLLDAAVAAWRKAPADLASTRPLRASAWQHTLDARFFAARFSRPDTATPLPTSRWLTSGTRKAGKGGASATRPAAPGWSSAAMTVTASLVARGADGLANTSPMHLAAMAAEATSGGGAWPWAPSGWSDVETALQTFVGVAVERAGGRRTGGGRGSGSGSGDGAAGAGDGRLWWPVFHEAFRAHRTAPVVVTCDRLENALAATSGVPATELRQFASFFGFVVACLKRCEPTEDELWQVVQELGLKVSTADDGGSGSAAAVGSGSGDAALPTGTVTPPSADTAVCRTPERRP